MKTIAFTGFGPFGPNETNPTEVLAGKAKKIEGVDAAVVPVSYSRCYEEAKALDGDILVMTGLAASRDRISIERTGWNWMDASIADADGVIRSGCPIRERGDARLSTSLPVEKILLSLEDEGIPACISDDPGRYVCNCIYYSALADGARPAVFIHFPSDEKMDAETKERALFAVIRCLKEA